MLARAGWRQHFICVSNDIEKLAKVSAISHYNDFIS